MINATDVKKGMVLKIKDEFYLVMDYKHTTPGNKRGFVQVKMRNIKTGAIYDEKFSSDERFERAFVEQKPAQFLYEQGGKFFFMDLETYDQLELSKEIVGENANFMKSEVEVKLNYCAGEIVGIEMPFYVELKIVETEPAAPKGATVSNVFKSAKLETGYTVQVPPFVEPGDIVRIDTRTGEYLERVKK